LRLSFRLPWSTSEIVDIDMAASAASLDCVTPLVSIRSLSTAASETSVIENFRDRMRLVLIALDEVGEHIKVCDAHEQSSAPEFSERPRSSP
jgi:hypothetical protein